MNSKRTQFGIGIVGCGNIARIHAEVILPSKKMELVAVYSRNSENARTLGGEFNVSAYDDWREFIRSDHLDVVYYDYKLGGLGWDGLQLLNWAIQNECAGHRVVIVSEHSTGKPEMEAVLKKAGYLMNEGHVWELVRRVDWEAVWRAAEATKHLRPQEYPESEKPKKPKEE